MLLFSAHFCSLHENIYLVTYYYDCRTEYTYYICLQLHNLQFISDKIKRVIQIIKCITFS